MSFWSKIGLADAEGVISLLNEIHSLQSEVQSLKSQNSILRRTQQNQLVQMEQYSSQLSSLLRLQTESIESLDKILDDTFTKEEQHWKKNLKALQEQKQQLADTIELFSNLWDITKLLVADSLIDNIDDIVKTES